MASATLATEPPAPTAPQTSSTTMAPTFSTEDSDLIASLHALSAKSPKLVKSSVYPAPVDPAIEVRSWKMNEFKYYDVPSPFPTLARGLFTREVKDDSTIEEGEGEAAKKHQKKYQIVVRGYDKFFNIGEVPWTTWASLEEHTAPPYTLSLKSNGCIIFIAALTPIQIIVTSKHSVGPVGTAELSHAQAGEQWLRKYLDKMGKTEADLAGTLWEKNWTAIAELCDDSFEEHVLGYPPEKTGLHLHGLNVRSKAFDTMPHAVVDAFAEEWGFIKTLTHTVNSIKEVKDFTTACAENGEWNGEPVEGFVVRTHVTEPPTSGRNSGGDKGKGKATEGSGSNSASDSNSNSSRSPYKPGSSFFFKVKFDEPYMMYRDWREVTKTLLSPKGNLNPANLPKSKMKRAETKVYVDWVIKEIKKDREAFKDYTKGKGIIATREKFLAWMKSGEGVRGLEGVQKEEEKEGEKKEFGKTIIVPVAIPGCGKTAVSVALAHIFGFGHTQSDDVHAKKPAPVFLKNVMDLLNKHDVVIADKNNHLIQHRIGLRDAASARFSMPVRLLALNWSLDKPPATIHRICGDRVQQRGDNHQTLRADSSAAKSHEEVIWMFINNTEELTPAEVDEVVEMEVEDPLETSVRRAVKGCVEILGLEEPGEEKIEEAIRVVQGYAPKVTRPDPKDKEKGKKAASASTPRYYGLLPEVDILELLDGRLMQPDVDEDMRDGWAKLKEDGRVIKRPHVTIVHRNALEVPVERTVWDLCVGLRGMADRVPPLFRGRLGRVLWNGRVMALMVDDFAVDGDAASAEKGQEAQEFVSKMPEEVRRRLHITVGTKLPSILPVEAKAMVELYREKGASADVNLKVVELKDVVVKGRVKGLNG